MRKKAPGCQRFRHPQTFEDSHLGAAIAPNVDVGTPCISSDNIRYCCHIVAAPYKMCQPDSTVAPETRTPTFAKLLAKVKGIKTEKVIAEFIVTDFDGTKSILDVCYVPDRVLSRYTTGGSLMRSASLSQTWNRLSKDL